MLLVTILSEYFLHFIYYNICVKPPPYFSLLLKLDLNLKNCVARLMVDDLDVKQSQWSDEKVNCLSISRSPWPRVSPC